MGKVYKKTKYKGVYEGTPTNDGRRYFYRARNTDINGNIIEHTSQKYFTAKEADDEKKLFILQKYNPYKKDFELIALDYFKNLEKIKKPKTIYNYKCDYKNHIQPYFAKKDINEVNNITFIKKWANELEKKNNSIAYNNKIYTILNNIMNYAVKFYGVKTNYVHIFGRFQSKNGKIVTDKEKLRFITYEEFNKFIKCVENYVFKTFFYFAYYTGCRKGEIFALTWKDIDFDTKEIYICKTLDSHTKDKNGNVVITNTKTGENRKVIMNTTLYNIMINYKNEMKKYVDFSEDWFVFGCSHYLSSTSVEREKNKAFEKSGVHRITMHEFRHSHVSLLINEYIKTSKEKNMKIDTTKFFLMMSNRMGHTIDVMQKTYMHLFPSIQDEIVDLLDRL